MDTIEIESLGLASDEEVQGLAAVLVDAVRGGASISFMSDLEFDEAAEWWRKTLSAASARAVVLVARDSAAKHLYSSLGWVRVGEVPHYALNPDGTWCDTVFFYKQV